MTVVIDASVLVAALAKTGRHAAWAEALVLDRDLVAPEVLLWETASVLRGLERRAALSRPDAELAHRELWELDLELVPFEALAERAWSLRYRLSIHDAAYVALGELSTWPVATLDLRLVRGAEGLCGFETPA